MNKLATKRARTDAAATRCRRKFLRFFPNGFYDEGYLSSERNYKWETHQRWEEALGRDEFRQLLAARAFDEICARAVRVEQRSLYSMIFSFEKMALRDAVKSRDGAQAFAEGLYQFLHGSRSHRAQVRSLGCGRCGLAAQTDSRADVAARDRLGFYRAAGRAHFPQTEREARRRAGVRIRSSIPLTTRVERLCELAGLRGARAARPA